MMMQSDVTTIRIFVDGNPRFYYVSDIHLELRKNVPSDIIEQILGEDMCDDGSHIKSSILVLAGDIGCPFDSNYEKFLINCDRFFAYVIVIAGNHEYYTSRQHTISSINRELIKVCARTYSILLSAGDNDSTASRVDIYSREVTGPSAVSSTEDTQTYNSNEDGAVSGDGINLHDNVRNDLHDNVRNDLHDDIGMFYNGPNVEGEKYVDLYTGDETVHDTTPHDTTLHDTSFNHIDINAVDLAAGSVESAIFAMTNVGDAYDSKLVARVVGCTLWSESGEVAALYMNDYKKIYIDAVVKPGISSGTRAESLCGLIKSPPTRKHQRTINVDDVCISLHKPQRLFIESEIVLANAEGVPLVVVTHHLPTFDLLVDKYNLRECYATNLTHLIAPPVIAWLCGHTHRSMIRMVGGVYCGINCYGYPYQTAAQTNFRSIYFEIIDGCVMTKK